jgi:hypothetical protein
MGQTEQRNCRSQSLNSKDDKEQTTDQYKIKGEEIEILSCITNGKPKKKKPLVN